MPKQENREPGDEAIEAQVSSELDEAKQFAKTLNLDEVKSGEWFLSLLRRVIYAYDRNARAEYFRQKYPGLPPDEIANILTSVTVRYATIAGAITGAAATGSVITTISSAGMTAPLLVGAIGAEMIYLARIQMRLVLDLSVVYDLQLDPEDPEDVLMIFGYALGAAPTEMVGKGVQVAARAGTTGTVKKYVSKGTLKAVQDFARRLGFNILQRTILKYAIPIASAAVGSGYNYVTTRSVGRIAKAHLKNRGRVTEELRTLVSRQNTYDLAFPAAAMYIAQVDGEFSAKEKELYRAILSRMSFHEHTQAEFRKLIASEANILEAVARIEDSEVRRSLIDVLVLMTVSDGELIEKEREFLANVAEHLNIPLNLTEVERKTRDYRVTVKQSIAGRTAGSVKDAATTASDKVRGVLGKVIKRNDMEAGELPASESSTITCPNCGREVPAEYQFCPGCGQSIASEKACSACSEVIPISFAFCSYCGASQG
jgi:tellurite resistance protein/RNA polymerase subunit RPABC4/transcription elongation factor Spt4